jgi:adenylate cyclase
VLAEALAIDPDYAVAAGLASWCYVARTFQEWESDRDTAKRAGIDLGHRAIATGLNDREALAFGGFALAFFEVDKRTAVWPRSSARRRSTRTAHRRGRTPDWCTAMSAKRFPPSR